MTRSSLLLLPLLAALVACSKPSPAPSPDTGAAQQPVASADAPERGPGHRRREHGEPGEHGRGRGGKGFSRMFDAERFLAHADKNKNGTVELTELPEQARARFAEADTNKDGALSREELEAFGQKQTEKRFARMDKNGDGSVSKDEMPERMWERFKVADADGNNAITLKEMIDAQKAGKLKFQGRRGPGDNPAGDKPEDKEPDLDEMIKGVSEDN